MMKNIIKQKSVSDNPYLHTGQKEWNDRYLNLTHEISHWKKACAGLIGISVVLSFGLIHLASQSRLQPFAVETNQGMPYAIKAMDKLSIHDQKLINYAVNQFIINAKTIVSDTSIQKALLDKAYAFSSDKTLNVLQAYYKTENPFTLAAQYNTTIHIISSLPTEGNSWEVTWDEIKHDASGAVIGSQRWVAHLTYKFGEVNEKTMNENPFGFYITDINWSMSAI